MKKSVSHSPYAPYLFLAPTILMMAIFLVYPVIAAFRMSFFDWNLMSGDRFFIGLKNYGSILTDGAFWISVTNTVKFAALYVFFVIFGGLAFSLILVNLTERFRKIVSTALFIPVVSSVVAVAIVWKYMYQPRYGLINYALESLNLPPVDWLHDSSVALWSVIIMTVWRDVGFYIIIFTAGLMGIPKTYYDAAQVDGASPIQCLRHVTLPLLSNTTFFNTVMAVIFGLKVFDQVWVLTKGGPGYGTRVVVLHLYETAFKFYRLGEGTAIAFVLFAMILVLTLIQFRYRKHIEY